LIALVSVLLVLKRRRHRPCRDRPPRSSPRGGGRCRQVARSG